MARKIEKTTAKKYSAVPPTATATADAAKAAKAIETAKIAEAAKPAIAAAASMVTSATVQPAATVTSTVPPTATVQPAAVVITAPLAATTSTQAPAAAEKSGDAQIIAATDASALIIALHDSDADIARDAATSLGSLGDRSAVEPLIEVLNNFDAYHHIVVRSAAAQSLAQLGDLRAVDSLLNAITDPAAEVSVDAIRALGNLGDKSATNAVIEVIRNRAGFFLTIARKAAVLALAQLGGEDAVRELEAVANDAWEEPAVREAAGHKACTEAAAGQTTCCGGK